MVQNSIKQFIEEFLSKLGAEIEAVEVLQDSPGSITFSVRSRDSNILIGSRGKHLSALNHVAQLIVKNRLGQDTPLFTIDVNYYRREQTMDLINDAKAAADRAKLFRRDVELHPMSSYERMVVHSALSEDPEVSTESYGEGKFRRVVVKYADKTESITL